MRSDPFENRYSFFQKIRTQVLEEKNRKNKQHEGVEERNTEVEVEIRFGISEVVSFLEFQKVILIFSQLFWVEKME